MGDRLADLEMQATSEFVFTRIQDLQVRMSRQYHYP
jgi:hypothetical protein